MCNPTRKKLLFFIFLSGLILLMTPGCSLGTPLTLQQKVRMFFYENQTDAGPMFVDWAKENLKEYPSRRIYDALYEEGAYHADLGHPNAISVISQAALAWSKKHGLRYKESDWLKLQEQALKKLRTSPGELKLWP